VNLKTIRDAIMNDYFTSFDQFEYALFRVIEQHKQRLIRLQKNYEERKGELRTELRRQTNSSIVGLVTETNALLTVEQRSAIARKHGSNPPIYITRNIPCRGRGRPL